jgi:hypothetical protein
MLARALRPRAPATICSQAFAGVQSSLAPINTRVGKRALQAVSRSRRQPGKNATAERKSGFASFLAVRGRTVQSAATAPLAQPISDTRSGAM